MLPFPRFTGCFFISALLTDIVCCGAEPPPQIDIPSPNLECPRRPSAKESAKGQQTANRESILESFKIATDGSLLLLSVEIQEKRYWFVLDTGSSTTFFDTSLRSLLGEPIKSRKIQAYDGNMTIPVFSSPEVKVGKLALAKNSEVFCRDLEKMRESSGQEIHGLLGMDFLRNYAFRIDFDRGELTFLSSVDHNSGERVPIESPRDFPCVRVETRGFTGRGRFHVDTGCAGFASGCIVVEGFDSLAKRGFLTLFGQTTRPANLWRSVEERFGCIDAISLGSFRHEKLVFAGSAAGNILGLNYWSRYIVTFDFPKSVMYLKKGRRFDQPDMLRDMSGLDIRRKEGQTFVQSVAKGSPSAQAGIQPQDILIKIDDTELTKRLFGKKAHEIRPLS